MNAVQNIVSAIRDTQAELSRAEKSLALHGEDFGVELAMESLQSRLEELQQEFVAATAADEMDVCSYRLVADATGRYPLAAVGRTFEKFQWFFTVLYDVIKRNEPRRRAKVAPESLHESSFDFGYAFSGSLGFVFTLPNERMLLGQSLHDMAIDALAKFPAAESTDEISVLAKRYGAAPVRLAYQWAQAHVEAGLDVDLEWKRGEEVRQHMRAEVGVLRRLTDLIASTSEVDRYNLQYYGKLVGIDTQSRTFHLVVDGKQDIRGSLHESFEHPQPLTVDTYYTAYLDVEVQVHYATGSEDRRNVLRALSAKLDVTTRGEGGPASDSSEGDADLPV